MQKTIRLLALLLGVQLMVAVALGLSGSRLSVPAQAGPLVEVDKARVDRLTIEDTGRFLRRDGSEIPW